MNDLQLEILQFLLDNRTRYSTVEIAKNLRASVTDVSKQIYILNDKGLVTRSLSNEAPHKPIKKLYKINTNGLNKLSEEKGGQANEIEIIPAALALEKALSKRPADTPTLNPKPTQQQKIELQLNELENKLKQKPLANKITLKLNVLDKLTEIMADDIGELLQEIKEDLVA